MSNQKLTIVPVTLQSKNEKKLHLILRKGKRQISPTSMRWELGVLLG